MGGHHSGGGSCPPITFEVVLTIKNHEQLLELASFHKTMARCGTTHRRVEEIPHTYKGEQTTTHTEHLRLADHLVVSQSPQSHKLQGNDQGSLTLTDLQKVVTFRSADGSRSWGPPILELAFSGGGREGGERL